MKTNDTLYKCSTIDAHLQVWKVAFWMRKYGHLSWKRTWLWSNSRIVGACDKGPMTPHERMSAQPTTTKYVDGAGKKRFKGNVNLKKSQNLFCISFRICFSHQTFRL